MSHKNVVFEENEKSESLANYVLNLFGDVDTPEVEEISTPNVKSMNPKVRKAKAVQLSLNSKLAGGKITGSKVLCDSIVKLKSKDGWVQINAKASNDKNITGWIHNIYLKKFNLQCKKATQISLL